MTKEERGHERNEDDCLWRMESVAKAAFTLLGSKELVFAAIRSAEESKTVEHITERFLLLGGTVEIRYTFDGRDK